MSTRHGFTIIEVLVVIVILGLIMAVGSVGFRDFQRRQIVTAAKRSMVADVRAAQSDIASGRKPDGCTGTLQGYGFRVTQTSPAIYETYAICTTASGDAEYLVKETNLGTDVTITVPTTNPVIFKPIAQGTNLVSGQSVTITISNTSSTESLVITASGEVR